MNIPLTPTPEMIEAGAQRLVNWQDDTVWPDSFSDDELRLWRTLAERVWRSMWTEAVIECLMEMENENGNV